MPLLHELVGFVDGSDVHQCPSQLIPTLRRYSKSILPGSEIIVSSKPELNYSIQDIAAPLRNLFSGTEVESSCALLPDLLFVVTIPVVESGQILIHGVLAHELGHAIYDRHGIAKSLLPMITVSEDMVKKLVPLMMNSQGKGAGAPSELGLRRKVTEEVTERVNGWVKELCSDAIGIQLFGPALFFAATHLLTSFSRIDKATETHPPARLRLRLMLRMLKQRYPVNEWSEGLQSLCRNWDEVSSGPVSGTNHYDQIALETINDAVLDFVTLASESATSACARYDGERFRNDIAQLAPMFLNHIPPGEMPPYIGGVPVGLASIINAGWHVYLCDFDKFRKSLHPKDGDTRFAAATKLHELVLKAIEISGIRISWEEARRDSKR